MIVNEIFYSLQGEGFLAGVPSVFIRLAGCPLRCRYCDTKYAWQRSAGDFYTIEKIIETIQQWQCPYVVITGGEPMVNPVPGEEFELPRLLTELKCLGKHITIETAGIAFIAGLACDLMSISPKLSNSVPAEPALAKIHEESCLDIAVLVEFIKNYNYQLKFVVDSEEDQPEIRQIIEEIGNVDSKKVMLMPQAKTRDELIDKSTMVAEICKQTGFVFSQRLQILLWNNRRAK